MNRQERQLHRLPLNVFCSIALALTLNCINGASNKGFSRAIEHTIKQVVHVEPPAPATSPYLYIPFDVPAGSTRLRVRYDYDHASDQNALDIGIIDSRSTKPSNDLKGFRGWSGGRRSEFFISTTSATPGYIPGKIRSGTWYILLGLYRVVPDGVDVAFEITIASAIPTNAKSVEPDSILEAPANRQPANKLVNKNSYGYQWISGDLHMHTVHSDGDWTITDILSAAQRGALDFVCITDHNTISHYQEIDRLRRMTSDLIVMRGEEITSYGGHANAWSLPPGKLIDFRIRPRDDSAVFRAVEKTHRANGLIAINHPFASCPGCSWSFDSGASGFDAIEVWNGTWDPSDERALAWWDKLLQQGRRITAIASSDSHRPSAPVGSPATRVKVKRVTERSIINSIRSGHVYLTRSSLDPELRFEAVAADLPGATLGQEIVLDKPGTVRFHIVSSSMPPGSMMLLISRGEIIHRGGMSGNDDLVIEAKCQQNSYFRLEIRNQAGDMLALTNPIYVKLKSTKLHN